MFKKYVHCHDLHHHHHHGEHLLLSDYYLSGTVLEHIIRTNLRMWVLLPAFYKQGN